MKRVISSRSFYDTPVLISSNIDKGEISSTGTVRLYFKEPLQKENVDASKITVKNVTTGEYVKATVYVSDKELSFEPQSGFVEGNQYQLEIPADAVKSKDQIPIKSSITKTFKTANLLTIISGPEKKLSEKRPELTVTFSNPLSKDLELADYFKLYENDNSNSNEELETIIRISEDQKSVSVIPTVSFTNGSSYKLGVDTAVKDIYDQRIIDKENVVYELDVDGIDTDIRKPS